MSLKQAYIHYCCLLSDLVQHRTTTLSSYTIKSQLLEINVKKTVVYIHLNGDVQWHTSKTAKIIKRWYYPSSHRLSVNVLLNNITFLWFLPFSMCESLHVAVKMYINCSFLHLFLYSPCWLGHVVWMAYQRMLWQALRWEIPGFKRGPGRPRTNWRSTVNKDLLGMGITWEEAEVAAHDRSEWVGLWPNASTWMRV